MRIRVASCKPADAEKGHGEEVTISIDASNWRHTDRRINAVCNGDWPDVMFVEGRIAAGLT